MQYLAGRGNLLEYVFFGGAVVAVYRCRGVGIPASVSWATAVPDGRVRLRLRAVDAESTGPGRVVPDGGR